MIADVSRPDLETRVAILRQKAINEGVAIGDDAVEFIASNISTNINCIGNNHKGNSCI